MTFIFVMVFTLGLPKALPVKSSLLLPFLSYFGASVITERERYRKREQGVGLLELCPSWPGVGECDTGVLDS